MEEKTNDAGTIAALARAELARRSFYEYCRLRAPEFYRADRRYLRRLCEAMQVFYEGERQVLVVNLPPRHGKTRTAALFAEWILGNHPQEKIIAASYNEILSTLFSRGVRDAIRETGGACAHATFSEVFAPVRLKAGETTAGLWSLEGAHVSFLATSPLGTATGFGCSLLLIDDLIRGAREAFDEEALARQWDWFANTMLSRLEEGGKILVVMTRWAKGDLAGRIAQKWGERAAVVSMPALGKNGKMLCPSILSRRSYESKCRAMGAQVAAANFQQQPIETQGLLYGSFRVYDRIARDERGQPRFSRLRCYIDAADTGSDFLCAVCYGETGEDLQVLEVLYTDEPMERTEPQTARMLAQTALRLGMRLEARVESNSGGRGFARAVARILEETQGGELVRVECFHQTKNKLSRILSSATWVSRRVMFPAGWPARWPEFYRAVAGYRRVGKNAHDDAPDALTGAVEWSGTQAIFSFD